MGTGLKLSTKIVLSISILSLVGLVALFIVVNTYIRSMVVAEVQEKFNGNNIIMANQIDDWIAELRHLIEGMSFAVESVPREQMYGITASFQSNHEDISLAFVGFPDGYAVANHGNPPAPGWYSFERPWYIAGVASGGQTVIEMPFWSATDQAWSTSASRYLPSLDGGTYGVTGFVIPMTSVLNMMNEFEIEGGGYVFLMGRGGEIISHPDPAFAPADSLFNMADSPVYRSVMSRIQSGENFIPYTTNTGVPSYILSYSLRGTDWIMVSVVPAAVINASISRIINIVMLTTFLVLIIVGIFVLFYVSRLIRGAVAASVADFRESSMALARGEGLIVSNDRDNSFGLDEIGKEFEQNLDIMSNLMTDLSRLSHEFIVNGDIEFRVSEERYSGAFKEVIQSVNRLAGSCVDDLMLAIKALDSVGHGDFSMIVNKLPGKKEILNQKLSGLTDNLKSVSADISYLTASAAEGRLDESVDASKYHGDWAKLIEGLNNLLNSVSKPLEEIERSLAEMSKGNFDVAVKGDYRGIFNKLKQTVNSTGQATLTYVDDIAKHLKAIANGDLSGAVDRGYIGSYGPIKAALITILKSLNDIMSEITSSVDQVAMGAEQIATNAMTLAEGATRQSASLEELSDSIELIHEKSIQANNNATAANQNTKRSQAFAVQGGASVQSMSETMTKISTSNESISKIIDVIANIAFQTNLLALNASVEAARAGEHGKGFSVVADEVRTLAGRSQQSVSDTSTIIENNKTEVEEGVKAAAEVVTSFETIANTVSETSGLISQIADISDEQLESISSINLSVSEINNVVMDTSATAEESASASQELSSQSDMLRQKVSFFKLR